MDVQTMHTYRFPPPKYCLEQLQVYETRTKLYVVGSDELKSTFHILKVDRTDPSSLSIVEDMTEYSEREVQSLLTTIQHGNRNVGGLVRTVRGFGIFGFPRYGSTHFLLLITKRKRIGSVGGNYIWQVEDTALVDVTCGANAKGTEKDVGEARFRRLMSGIATSKDFFFSYTYDLSRTLQYNLKAGGSFSDSAEERRSKSMYVWNDFLLSQADDLSPHWTIPVISGHCGQRIISVYSKPIGILLIARRSRHFAGTRFLRRGLNEKGKTANDVEVEQIVYDAGMPAKMLRYSSIVQVRGSIPLFWTQESAVTSPKPPITIQLIDPFYRSTRAHFEDLVCRYGGPLLILNLVKSMEKSARESKLLHEYGNAVLFLNQFLDEKELIDYIPWDLQLASKRKEKVLLMLDEIAGYAIRRTGFFSSVPTSPSEQTGVLRSNCIDSLDRTNVAQFALGKVALGYQFHAFGLLDRATMDYDSPYIRVLMDLYQEMGDTLALQYAGSMALHSMDDYVAGPRVYQRKDWLEQIRRFYSNTFTDFEKQVAINLFLGKRDDTSSVEVANVLRPYGEVRDAQDVVVIRDWFQKAIECFGNVSSPSPRSSLVEESVEKRVSPKVDLFQRLYQPQRYTNFERITALTEKKEMRFVRDQADASTLWDETPSGMDNKPRKKGLLSRIKRKNSKPGGSVAPPAPTSGRSSPLPVAAPPVVAASPTSSPVHVAKPVVPTGVDYFALLREEALEPAKPGVQIEPVSLRSESRDRVKDHRGGTFLELEAEEDKLTKMFELHPTMKEWFGVELKKSSVIAAQYRNYLSNFFPGNFIIRNYSDFANFFGSLSLSKPFDSTPPPAPVFGRPKVDRKERSLDVRPAVRQMRAPAQGARPERVATDEKAPPRPPPHIVSSSSNIPEPGEVPLGLHLHIKPAVPHILYGRTQLPRELNLLQVNPDPEEMLTPPPIVMKGKKLGIQRHQLQRNDSSMPLIISELVQQGKKPHVADDFGTISPFFPRSPSNGSIEDIPGSPVTQRDSASTSVGVPQGKSYCGRGISQHFGEAAKRTLSGNPRSGKALYASYTSSPSQSGGFRFVKHDFCVEGVP